MLDVPAMRLVTLLSRQALRNRTGILLLPPAWLGLEREVAARLGIGYADHRAWILSQIRPTQRKFGRNWMGLISTDLERLVGDARTDGGCVLIANLDILLCSLRAVDRQKFWRFLRERYLPTHGLLLALPKTSERLIGDDERTSWESAERLACWE